MKGSKIIFKLGYIFLAAPFVIFTLGYMRIWFALPIIMITFFSLFQMFKDIPEIDFPQVGKRELLIILCSVLFIILWVMLSGVGKIGWQRGDHTIRNGIYEALVREPWPVGMAYLNNGQTDIKMLVYYIGFWMPSAVIGKIFGIQAGYYFQVFWAIMGLVLLYFFISIWRKKFSAWPIVIFIFFSGLDIIILSIMKGERIPIFSIDFIEEKTCDFLFTSFTIDLFDVFNQAIPAWVATIIILLQKNTKSIIFIWSFLLLSATFPFVGLLPIIIYMVYRLSDKNVLKDSKKWYVMFYNIIKELFTFRNIAGGGVVGIITALYLMGNISGGMIGTHSLVTSHFGNIPVAAVNAIPEICMGFQQIFRENIISNTFVQYLIFILLEFICYYIFMFKYYIKNPLFYVILFSLMTIPFIKVGSFVDFCMRASIPPLFILYLLVIEYLQNSKQKIGKILVCILLMISSISAMHQIANSIVRFGEERQRTATVREVCLGSNFGGPSDTVFFKYLSKPFKPKEFETLRINYCEPDESKYIVRGPEFSKEENQLVASELYIEFNCTDTQDITFIDRGMLDDNSVTYSVELNGHELGTLNYDDRIVVLRKEYLNEYAQSIIIRINRQVKLYNSDDFKLYIAE